MRVLVTGGAGYIGSIAVELLIEKGYQVSILDDLSSGHQENVSTGARFFNGSLLDEVALNSALEDCTAVLHFAGKSLVGESVEKPDLYQQVNVKGTENLLIQMRKKKIKELIFSSSAATYGDVEKVPIKETSPINPRNPYGFTKLQIEKLISRECAEYGLSAVSLRYFNVAGALKTINGWLSEKHNPETHLIPNVLKSTTTDPIKVFGTDWQTDDGTCIRDYVHVIDLVEAHLMALESLGAPEHRIYNLGSGKGYSVRQVIEAANKVSGTTTPFVETGRRSGDPAVLVADISKVKKELNWAPVRNLEEMVEDAFLASK